MTIYPSGEEILIVGSIACGSQVVVGEQGQFEANVNRPATSAFGADAYPTAWDKAGALLHAFATTQCLLDGNKRTAWASAWLLLRLNTAVGTLVGSVDPEAAEGFVLRVAAGSVDVPEIADCLRGFAHPQLGISGKLPDGFRLTTPLEDVDGMLIGQGSLPDNTELIYLYMTAQDGTPSEMLFTPEQARETARVFERIADGDVNDPGTLQLAVSAYVRHHDLHDPPKG
ncbi:MAG: Fic family protein [Gordonia amarae]